MQTKSNTPAPNQTLEAWLQEQDLINIAGLAAAAWPDKSRYTAKARLFNHLSGRQPLGPERKQQLFTTLQRFADEVQTKLNQSTCPEERDR